MSGDLESNAELAPAYLVQRKGASTGRRFALEEGEHIIGRGTGISVQIDSSEVSRHHARILVDAGGAELFDLGSKNGIWVGSNRVEGTARIGHGDHFTLGDVEFELEHACSRAAKVLALSGEATTTTARPRGSDPGGERRHSGHHDVYGGPTPGISNLWLLLGLITFSGLALASWWLPW